MGFGVKILIALVRPFLRLRVLGRENLHGGDSPAVFVCNHGIFYGPIAAAIYLPVKFRPWVDIKMTDVELCVQEIYDREIYKATWLPERFRRWLCRIVARPVARVLNSFDPIPVDKRTSQAAVKVFSDTVDALIGGDNILIFPERPKRVKRRRKITVRHERYTIGDFYTGFANIGQLYYEQGGRSLLFYPVYANRELHTFTIGKPIRFQPDNDPQKEKQRIAGELHARILDIVNSNN